MSSKFICSFFALVYLAGCASPAPQALTAVLADNPSPDIVRNNPEQFQQQSIRWGGEVASVFNGADFTELVVISRPLDKKGKPRPDTLSLGRFIARLAGFLEPEEFETYKYITVTGIVIATEERKIDDYKYRFPVVDADQYFSWKEAIDYGPSRRPYYYDPWPYYYDPFWRPYWPRHPRHHRDDM